MTGFTPEEWRTAARVARRSIFTEGNPDLADVWEKAADQVEARLVPAGGMALTAEQVEDVRTMLWSPGVTALAAFRRLRALFPATEPAEEETKAELCAGGDGMYPCVLPARHYGVHADRRGLRWNYPTSSPVVPAPTETEWQTWQEVPEGVKYSPKARPPAGSPLRLLAQPLWVNRGGTRYQARSGTVSKIGDVEMFHYAPFVAAKEG